MTIEAKELKDFFKDEKNADIIKDLIGEIGLIPAESVSALKKNTEDALKEKKKLKEQVESLQKMLDDIDIDEYNELKTSKSSGKGNNDELVTLKKDFKKLSDKYDAESKRFGRVESELNESLKKAAIGEHLPLFAEEHHKMILRSFQGKAKVEIDGDNRTVKIEDDDGTSLLPQEFFKKYADGEGKIYLKRADNRGSGSKGYSGSGGQKSMSRKDFDSLSPDDKRQAVKDKVSIVD